MDNPESNPAPVAALYYHPDGYVAAGREKLMGRHAAGEGFLRGYARHGRSPRLFAFAKSREHFNSFTDQINRMDAGRECIWLPQHQPGRLAEAGALYLPGPDLARHAWQRQRTGAGAYSIIGITHTVCTDRVVDALGEMLTAPVESWDALICTSPAVRDAVLNTLSSYGEYLGARFGIEPVPARMQMPIIPLGIDCDAFAPADHEDLRQSLRRRHGIADDDVVVLFLGRLSYHAKAHPGPMYLGLEAASRTAGRRLHLIQAGWFANESIRQSFVEGAKTLCPSVNAIFVDGREPGIRNGIWHAADIFCSLPDNIQETFGLTAVEAMAAGLPVIASDWDGYRGSLVHGESGYLIPTAMPSAGAGEELADMYFTGRDSYDRYIGRVSQCVSVDVDAVAAALTELAGNPELRRKMGHMGRERARRLFDWRVVISAYEELWLELGRRRTAADAAVAGPGPVPLRDDPFRVYAHYATSVHDMDTCIRAAVPDPAARLAAMAKLPMFNFAGDMLVNRQAMQALVARLEAAPDGLPVRDLLESRTAQGRSALQRTVGWLLKLGIVKAAP